MKKTRIAKIFVLILSLALLVGSAVCVMASADEGDYSIKSVNISHGDKIRVLVAVDAPVEEAANITVSYVYGGETLTAKYWKNVDIYQDGTEYPVYYTVGISAKDMGEDIIAKVGNGEAKNISVAQYLYQRLYKDGFINATEEKEVNKKNLYLKLLDYGARAQTVLWNNKAENANNQRTLVTDYSYADVTDGTVNGVAGAALVKGAATVNYTGTDAGFVGWDVTSYIDGEAVTERIYKASFTAEEGVSFFATPFIKANFYTFEMIEVGTGVYNEGDSTATTEKLTGTLPDVIKVSNQGSIFGLNSYAQVMQDESDGNKYLALKSTGRTPANAKPPQVILYTGTASNHVDIATTAATMMECDMKVVSSNSNSTTNRAFTITFHQSTNFSGTKSGANSTFYVFVYNGSVTIKRNGTTTSVALPSISDNEWFNFKAEYTKATGELKILIDGVEALTTTMNDTSATTLLYDMVIQPYDAYTSEMYIDNYYFEHTPAEQ